MFQIYIADDNVDFADYLATLARQRGWSTEVCYNGTDLLDRLSMSNGPALVLIDINMPEMDGIEAIEGIVEVDRPLHMRFMTGGSDSSIVAAQMIAKARDLKVGRNVYKPLSKDNFLEILESESGALAIS